MKLILNKHPSLVRIITALFLYGIALFLSTILDGPVLKKYFPYLSALLLLIATWFLYRTEHKSLGAIGLNFKLKNVALIPLGLLIGAIAVFLTKCARALYTGESIVVSDIINFSNIWYSLYFILPTVAVEEFLFRGYLFKKTIEISNVVIANVIFSILFMLIHVLDDGVMNNMGMIILLTVSIPVGHLMFATALLKSNSLFFPIGLHLGNNWATRHLVSNSNNGDSIFYIINNVTFETWPLFIGYVIIVNGIHL